MDWKKFFDSLGLNGTRWYWRIERWKRGWGEWREGLSRKNPQVSEQHKFCSQCKALLKRNEKTCPRCGARAPNWHAQKAVRLVSGFMPTHSPISSFLLIAIVLLGAPFFFFQVMKLMSPEAAKDVALIIRHLLNTGDFGYADFVGGEYYRAISYLFLHGGIMHLIFNALALSQVGPMLEDEIGSARFLVAYLLTGFGAVLLQIPFGGTMVGASGSIFGLIGFGAVYSHFHSGGRGKEMRNFFLQWAFIGFVFGIAVTIGGTMRIANGAHLGGFLVGALLGFVIAKERRARWDRVWGVLAGVGVLAIIGAFGMWYLAWQALGS